MEYTRLREQAVEHIKKGIARNKQVIGIDFSQFVAEYIGFCTMHKYLKILEREGFGARLPLRLTNAQIRLTKDLGKPVNFGEFAKAGVAIVQIYNQDELDELDDYAEGLAAKLDMQYFDANDLAIKHFIGPSN